MKKVAVLMSVFNRKETTLACLKTCFDEITAAKTDGKYDFVVYMTEDACTDGTPDAVAAAFPEVVIIRGSGNLYWNRGMCMAWNEAAKDSPDFYIWLNDDTMLRHGAFSVLLDNSASLGHDAIVVGTAAGSDGSLTYGGRTRSGKIIRPDDTIPVACDVFNGNLVLVPSSVYNVLGTMDPCYSHSFGDYDYGVRALKADVTAVVAPGILADCDRDYSLPQWRDASYTLRERYAAITSPKGRPFREQFIYDFRNYGILKAVTHFVSLNLKILFPKV